MTELKYTSTTVKAAFPRAKRYSTVRSNDRLQLALNRYQPPSRSASGFTLIFLHCTGFQKETWEEVIKYIFNQSDDVPIREAIAFDWVGHGDSALLNKGKLGYDLLWSDGSRDLVAMIDELQIPQPIISIGHSMGGGQALAACHLRPRLFTACIAIEPVAYPFALYSRLSSITASFTYLPDIFRNRESAVKFLMSSTWKSFDTAVMDRLIETGFYHPYADERVAFKSSSSQQTALYTARSSLDEIFAGLPYVDEPVLLVIAENGRWNPDEAPQALSRALRNSETVVIPGARHMLVQEIPRTAGSVIVSYLSKTWTAWAEEQQHEKAQLQEELQRKVEAGLIRNVNMLRAYGDESRKRMQAHKVNAVGKNESKTKL
ncbi:Alpha/Beta hydrolase protein [Lipomyces tetrasporus]|uniref:Alpha/Beta hydrolase protein n=1 Tax=Lipomyces tetrasporus TaxID=54092 RepID=A0AAD7VTB3_9ASCO|nr:Alpha/Beta hydrolase protein [Lipomyces tetrasporus]KAJ8101288.1 Alpha/Beta hydrolase protein [Lipomyces tetrasporus]